MHPLSISFSHLPTYWFFQTKQSHLPHRNQRALHPFDTIKSAPHCPCLLTLFLNATLTWPYMAPPGWEYMQLTINLTCSGLGSVISITLGKESRPHQWGEWKEIKTPCHSWQFPCPEPATLMNLAGILSVEVNREYLYFERRLYRSDLLSQYGEKPLIQTGSGSLEYTWHWGVWRGITCHLGNSCWYYSQGIISSDLTLTAASSETTC